MNTYRIELNDPPQFSFIEARSSSTVRTSSIFHSPSFAKHKKIV